MDIFDTKTDKEIHESLLAEIAKANNELNCANRDVKKAQSRLQFAIMALNQLINR